MDSKEDFIKQKIDQMSLDQKVGALMTLGFNGTIVTPNIYDYITRFQCGGLRVTPPERTFGNYVDPNTGKAILSLKGGEYFYKQGVNPPEFTAEEYRCVLDELTDLARQRPLSLPLHVSFDNEGEGNCSFSGFSMFPQPMGLRSTGDKRYAYEVAKVIGRQARSVGMNVIHSPVLDVNSDPRNITAKHNIFEMYLGVTFEFFCASELNSLDMVQAARIYPNVYPGGLWWFNFRRSVYEKNMQYRVEALPACRSTFVASDARCIEWCYIKILLIKKIMAGFLYRQIEEGWLDEDAALYTARCWLHDTAKQLYVRD